MNVLPDAPPACCPWCATPGITPIYTHDNDKCAHYVCRSCSERHGPGGRWWLRMDTTGCPGMAAA